MTTLAFLAEWALRSSVLILGGAMLLSILRVKDPAFRLAAWTAMLFGSLAIPALTVALPKVPFAVMRVPAGTAGKDLVVHHSAPGPAIPPSHDNDNLPTPVATSGQNSTGSTPR